MVKTYKWLDFWNWKWYTWNKLGKKSKNIAVRRL